MKSFHSLPSCAAKALAFLTLFAISVASQKRITGGVDSVQGRRPYSVSLQDFGGSFCGATLVAPDVVMTAAHCGDNLINAFLGRIAINPYDLRLSPAESFSYESYIYHPDFGPIEGYSNNDVMIIKLDGTSSFDYIEINSNASFPVVEDTLQVIGWGRTNRADSTSAADILQEVDVTYISSQRCEDVTVGGFASTTFQGRILDGMMCGLGEFGGNSCSGDSGGGVIASGENASSDIQVGIVSWGIWCGLVQYPKVYVRTSYYFDFIRESICLLSNDPPEYLNCDELTPTPSLTPSVQAPILTTVPTADGEFSTVMVTIVLKLDSYPTEIGWQVSNEDAIVIARAQSGTYNESGFVTEELKLQENATYFFTVYDNVAFDGIGGGSFGPFGPDEPAAILYLGSPSDEKPLVVLDRDFQFAAESIFVAGVEGVLEESATFAPTDFPTAAPSVITAAPTAPGDSETVVMVIELDSFPRETYWQLRNSDGVLIQSVPPQTYQTSNTRVTESFQLADGGTYTINLFDTWGDGISNPVNEPDLAVFLGDPSEGQYLASLVLFGSSASATFVVGEQGIITNPTRTFPPVTSPPSSTPSISLKPSAPPSTSNSPSTTFAPTNPTANATVLVRLDLFESETRLQIGQNISGFSTVLYEVDDFWVYDDYEVVTLQFELTVGETYDLTLFDRFCDGIVISLPPLEVYYGNAVDGDFKLASIDSGSFGCSETISFVMIQPSRSPSSMPSVTPIPTITPAPSVFTAIVSVIIRLDYYHYQTELQVLQNVSDVLTVVYEVTDFTVYNRYEEVTLQFELLDGESYVMLLTDSFCSGLSGSLPPLEVYFGDTIDEELKLASIESGSFGCNATASFVLIEPSRSPSSMPSISMQPSVSSAPSAPIVIISIVVNLDSYQSETGLQILTDTPIPEIVFEVTRTEFSMYDDRAEVLIQVELNEGSAYILRLTDSFGDGLLIFPLPPAIVYFGEVPDPEFEIASITDSSFGTEINTTFVASVPTRSPSWMPSYSPLPTVTPAPSISVTNVTVLVRLDLYQYQTRIQILQNISDVPTVLYEFSNFELYSNYEEVALQYEVRDGEAYDVILYDSFCSGLSVSLPPLEVFYGNTVDGDFRLASVESGNFGCSARTSFVVIEPSRSPSSAPSVTPIPTTTPLPTITVAPTFQSSRFLAIRVFLVGNRYTDHEALDDVSSPQYLAAQALAESSLFIPRSSSSSYTIEQFVERWAVMVFYFSTNGPTDWTSDWGVGDFSASYCSWNDGYSGPDYNGIYCSNARVYQARFDNNTLSGSLPTELGLLTNMEYFSVVGNDIGGTIPSELASWTSMDIIDLNFNAFTGTMPDWIGLSSTLRIMGMSNNFFEGSLPSTLSESTTLWNLGIDDNLLTGSIAPLNGLVNITLLHAQSNALEGTLTDTTFASLTDLQNLDLSNNKLNGNIPSHFFEFAELENLDLNGNELSGTIPSIPTNPTLNVLALHRNGLTGTIPESIVNLEALTHLDLTSNGFTGSMPRYLGDMTTLEYLFLADIDFDQGRIPLRFHKLTELRDLSLKNTNRNQPIPTWFGEMDHMILLDLDSNRLKGTVPTELGDMMDLTYLLLNRNLLTGTIPTELAQLSGSLLAATFDHNEMAGSATELCGLLPDIYLTSDCFESSPVDCPCCFECCDPDEADCHSEDLLAQFDPIWETGFERYEYFFGDYNITDRRQLSSRVGHGSQVSSVDDHEWEKMKPSKLRG